MPRRAPAFTLIELLVVISIIVVLLALLVPGLEKAMASSQKAKCGTNLKAIGTACATYLNDSISRSYPKTDGDPWSLFGKRGEPPDTNNKYSTANFDSDKRPLNKYLGITSAGSDVKVAQCPSDSGDATIDPDGATGSKSNDPTGTGALDPVVAPTPTNTMTAGGCSNVYRTQGTSYVAATYYGSATNPASTGIQAVFSPNGPMQASAAKPASSKILVGDGPMYGDRAYSNRMHRWHEADKTKRTYNLVFADGHVEFFLFKYDTAAGKAEIETFDANTQANPSRGYW